MRIFLSYRRSDSLDITARLADRLIELPAVTSVFLDVESINAGEAFPERLKAELAKSDVCLVLIGSNWIGAAGSGQASRISLPDDFVRMEVAEALRLKKRTIPVLIDNSTMPAKEELPGDLHPLLERNAAFLRHVSFHQDVEIISDGLLQNNKGRLDRKKRSPVIGAIARAAVGLVLAIAMLLIIGTVSFLASGGRSLESLLGDRLVLLALALMIAAGCQAIAFGKIRLPRPGRK